MATFTKTVAVSELLKKGGGTRDVEGRQTKEEYRKMKELEEQRKEGVAPAMIDVETGRDINPHIPQFISQTPWYVQSSGPTLKHQRPHQERQKQMGSIEDWYERGVTGRVSTKYRKGACENCGALTHARKDCFERPRKTGARWTGEDIAPDEFNQPKLELGWDAKRDRWNGYDPAEHRQVVEEFQKLEETRKVIKAEQLKEAEEGAELLAKEGAAASAADHDDEDKYAEDADMAGVTVDMDSRTRITVRNLRIREDTAKYLYNLDENGPYYDPKSRSMRENPFAGVPGKETEAVKFGGENFVRYTGEVVEAGEAQVFAWNARQKGVDVHALAEPTKLEALQREFIQQKHLFKDEQKRAILDKYGGDEHLCAPPKELIMAAQSEHYVEYNRKGKLLKGEEKPIISSRYEEDRYHNNHTAIWGSYWKEHRWGYACCHSFLRNSYCIGSAGLATENQLPSLPTITSSLDKAAETIDQVPTRIDSQKSEEIINDNKVDDESSSDSESTGSDGSKKSETAAYDFGDMEKSREDAKRKRDTKRRDKRREKKRRQRERKAVSGGVTKVRAKKTTTVSSSSSSSSSSSDSELSADDSNDTHEQSSMKKALRKAEKDRVEGERQVKLGDRKRKYHSNYEVKAPTELDIEAYRITSIHSADPMANYIEGKRRRPDE